MYMTDDFFNDIGLRMAQVRSSRDFTQDELAEALGITQTHLSSVENGRARCSLGLLIAFCEHCRCSMDYIIFGRTMDDTYGKLPDKVIEVLQAGDSWDQLVLDKTFDFYTYIVSSDRESSR